MRLLSHTFAHAQTPSLPWVPWSCLPAWVLSIFFPTAIPPPWSWCPALSLPGEVSGPWGVGFLLPLGQLGVPDAVGIWFGGGWAAPGAFVFVCVVRFGWGGPGVSCGLSGSPLVWQMIGDGSVAAERSSAPA